MADKKTDTPATPKAPSSKTVASIYANKKGVRRAQVMFDESKLNEDGSLTEGLIREIEAAIAAKRAA